MRTVAVIGAGQMGSGIAQVSAAAGYQVLLSDIDLGRASAGTVIEDLSFSLGDASDWYVNQRLLARLSASAWQVFAVSRMPRASPSNVRWLTGEFAG